MHDRVLLSDVLGEYIPDYRCILIQLKDYSNQELMDKENELSVIMMVDEYELSEEEAAEKVEMYWQS